MVPRRKLSETNAHCAFRFVEAILEPRHRSLESPREEIRQASQRPDRGSVFSLDGLEEGHVDNPQGRRFVSPRDSAEMGHDGAFGCCDTILDPGPGYEDVEDFSGLQRPAYELLRARPFSPLNSVRDPRQPFYCRRRLRLAGIKLAALWQGGPNRRVGRARGGGRRRRGRGGWHYRGRGGWDCRGRGGWGCRGRGGRGRRGCRRRRGERGGRHCRGCGNRHRRRRRGQRRCRRQRGRSGWRRRGGPIAAAGGDQGHERAKQRRGSHEPAWRDSKYDRSDLPPGRRRLHAAYYCARNPPSR